MQVIRLLGLSTLLCLTNLVGQAQPAYQWVENVYTFDNSMRQPVFEALDASGNLYTLVRGWQQRIYIKGTLYRSPYTVYNALIKYDPTGNVLWVRFLGTSSSHTHRCQEMRVDAAGNVIITGDYESAVTIDGTLLQCAASPNSDYFVAKWTPAGTLAWAVNGGGSGRRQSSKLAVDAGGSIYITGMFYASTSQFGPFQLTRHGFGISYVAKFAPTGAIRWVRSVDAPDTTVVTYSRGLGTDASGNVYLMGESGGSFSWDEVLFQPVYDSTHQFIEPIFWLKLDSTGRGIFGARYQSKGGTYDPQLAVDAAGYSYLTAGFLGTINIGGARLTTTGDTARTQFGFPSSRDVFLARLDPFGAVQWIRHIHSLDTVYNQVLGQIDVAADNQGKVYLAGAFRGKLMADGITLANVPSPRSWHNLNGFTAAFDQATGLPAWTVPAVGYGGNVMAYGGADFCRMGVSVAPSGEVGVVGTWLGDSARFGNLWVRRPAGAPQGIFFAGKIVQQYNVVEGLTYYDQNLNGVRDAGEGAYPSGLVVEVTPGPMSVATEPSGLYRAVVGMGTYQVSLPNPPRYHTVLVSGPPSTTFSAYGAVGPNRTFAVQPLPGMQDLEVSLTVGRARPGLPIRAWITYRNVGTAAIPSGTITLAFDPRLHYDSSSVAATPTPQLLTWAYANLLPNQSHQIKSVFRVDTSLVVGDSLLFTATLHPLAGDLTPDDNVESEYRLVSAAFDPNDITVDRKTLAPSQVQAGQWLTYTVRFQNVGNDTAFTVMLRDTLPAHQLNLATLQLRAASHPYTWSLSPEGVLTVNFTNIRLPHRAVDDPGSNGFLRFRVRPNASLALGDSVTNRAHIYFDFNPPVATNTALTTVVEPLGTATRPHQLPGSVWPNPATAALQVEARLPAAGSLVMRLLDAGGRVVRREALDAPAGSWRGQVDLRGLAPGLYLLDVQGGALRLSRHVVVQP